MIRAALVVAIAIQAVPGCAEDLGELWRGIEWDEPSRTLLMHFGGHATALPQPIDFGDSYSDIVRRDVILGGFPLIAFYQMDKRTLGLKRIQLERQRHGVTPAAFRGVLGALEAAYGAPDAMCGVRPGPQSGYQATAERTWRRDGVVIRTIFRDTTIEAFEGCLFGDPSLGPCGLTGQLLVRISPLAADGTSCLPPRP